MHIELAPELGFRIQREAESRGITPEALAVEVLEHSVSLWGTPLPRRDKHRISDEQRQAFFDDHLAWMKANSPGWETVDPYAVDWQAIKAEGRRY